MFWHAQKHFPAVRPPPETWCNVINPLTATQGCQDILKCKLRILAADSPKPRKGHILGYVAKTAIPRTVHPQPPTFCGFHPWDRPDGRLDPCAGAHLAAASCKLHQNMWVPNWVNGVHRGQKRIFFLRTILDHVECQNWARLDSVKYALNRRLLPVLRWTSFLSNYLKHNLDTQEEGACQARGCNP